ncbi:MAG: ABC transporter ATP-binding protein, partial [Ignisphaera sp.]
MSRNPDKTIISIEYLKVYYRTSRGYVKAVDDVSFQVKKGLSLGVAGESGCGKSTLGRALIRLLPSNALVEGRIFLEGVDILRLTEEEFRGLRWKKISYVPQASQNSLNPIMTVYQHFVDTAQSHGIEDKAEIMKKAQELLSLVGLDPQSVMNRFPHELSGGMRQRAVIALALMFNPDVVILDEPTTAIDPLVQRYILDTLKEIKNKTASTIIIISHDIGALLELTERMAIMYAGKIVEHSRTDVLTSTPSHPYTDALVRSTLMLSRDVESVKPIYGLPPSLLNPPPGCRFHPRCPYT